MTTADEQGREYKKSADGTEVGRRGSVKRI